MTFKAFSVETRRRELVVVDLGYSAHARSCGLYWTNVPEAVELQFGDAVRRVAELVVQRTKPILVLEAVLSTYHAPSGNPDIRGDFERGRGWYWGPGVLSFAAAIRFLQELNRRMEGRWLDIAEAFLSNKDMPTGHGEDAVFIYEYFWDTAPEGLKQGVEPASPLVDGVPSVRVFTPNSPEAV
jgi:hypothetical protein